MKKIQLILSFFLGILYLNGCVKDDNGDIDNYVSIEYKVIKRNDHHNLTGGGGDDSNP